MFNYTQIRKSVTFSFRIETVHYGWGYYLEPQWDSKLDHQQSTEMVMYCMIKDKGFVIILSLLYEHLKVYFDQPFKLHSILKDKVKLQTEKHWLPF